MNHSIKVGVSFGLTSSVITTLGLMVGLYSSTNLLGVVLGGIIIIALADAMSDAAGIHMSEESEGKHSAKEIWTSTLTTFSAKFLFTITFLVPLFFLPLNLAILVSIAWGLILIAVFTYYITKKKDALHSILEHLIITIVVVILTYFLGKVINYYFG